MRPSTAPHGAPELSAQMVADFARSQRLQSQPATHRSRLGLDQSRSTDDDAEQMQHSGMMDEGDEEEHVQDEEQHARTSSRHSTSAFQRSGAASQLYGQSGTWAESHDEDALEAGESEQEQHSAFEEQDEDEAYHSTGEEPHESSAGHTEGEAEGEGEETEGEEDLESVAPSDRVRVAVRVRPLLPSEQRPGLAPPRGVAPAAAGTARLCVSVSGNDVMLARSRVFTFDRAFGPNTPQEAVYAATARSMVRAAFVGFNGTIFAYGQTSAGKSYSMGSGSVAGVAEHDWGLIPRVVRDIFARVSRLRRASGQESSVRVHVSYLEIYREELVDLLAPPLAPGSRAQAPQLSIREEPGGEVRVLGAREEEARDIAHVMQALTRGAAVRTTGSTRMNEHSSRSHSIFTITLEQKRAAQPQQSQGGGARSRASSATAVRRNEVTRSKFHLVDLAGSERAKKTGAEGVRFQESIQINRGLLALGNVIQALSTPAAAGGAPRHVPYRDSKLTRVLASSLGGNAYTYMLACVSPAESCFEETHTTLKYAARARNIRNRPVLNVAEEIIPEPPAASPPPPAQSQQVAQLQSANAAKDAQVAAMAQEIARLQSALSQRSVERPLSMRDGETDEHAAAGSEEEEDHQSDESILRAHHSSLARAFEGLQGLYSSLRTEHSWLLGGLVFFVRSLGELFELERQRDESKDAVIALRRDYDALVQSAPPSDADAETTHAHASRVSELSAQVRAAQKSYVTYRDMLARLREDLSSFLSIYASDKLSDMQQREGEWDSNAPKVDVQQELDLAERPLRSARTGNAAADAAVLEENSSLRSALTEAREELDRLRNESNELRSALSTAQEDLKFDDEIFEEKVRAIRDLQTREAAARAQVDQLRETNKRMQEMMEKMGEEVRRKLDAATAGGGGGMTARSNAGGGTARSARPGTATPHQAPQSVSLSGRPATATPSIDETPLRSARGPPVFGASPGSTLATPGGATALAPEFARRTQHLAQLCEEGDEVRVADFEASMDALAAGLLSPPHPSTARSRLTTASKAPSIREQAQPQEQEESEEVQQLRADLADLRARRDSLIHSLSECRSSLEGLESHMASRRSAHEARVAALQRAQRDVRVQARMKGQRRDELTAEFDAVSAAAQGGSDSSSAAAGAATPAMLREAEERYAGLEQELSLKQRLLSALSPRGLTSSSSRGGGGGDPSQNVRSTLERDVRELEAALKDAADALEQMQLGGSGPQGAAAQAAASAQHMERLHAELDSIEDELAQLVEQEQSLRNEGEAEAEEYAQARAADKQRLSQLQQQEQQHAEELAQLQADIDDVLQQLRAHGIEGEWDSAAAQGSLSTPLRASSDRSSLHIELTTASGSKKRPITTGSTPLSPAPAAPSPAAAADLRRKSTWLSHQVSRFLDEEAQLRALEQAKEEERRLRAEANAVREKREELLERSMRASGAASMVQLIRAANQDAAAADGTAALRQSLQVTDEQLRRIDSRSSTLLRQSVSLRSARGAGHDAQQQQQRALADLQDELAHLAAQRAEAESQRQHILSQLASAASAQASAADSSAALDGSIVDGSLLATLVSAEERAALAQLDDTLDDLELQMELRRERAAELQQALAVNAVTTATAAGGSSTARGIRADRPTTALPVAEETEGGEEEDETPNVEAHREAFLSKAASLFAPSDAGEAALMSRELVSLAVEKARSESEAAAARAALEQQLGEKEARLRDLEAHMQALLRDTEARIASAQEEARRQIEQERVAARPQPSQHQQPTQTSSPQVVPGRTLSNASREAWSEGGGGGGGSLRSSTASTLSAWSNGRSPQRSLQTLKAHMHRASQVGLRASAMGVEQAAGAGASAGEERNNGQLSSSSQFGVGKPAPSAIDTSASTTRPLPLARTHTPAELPLGSHTPLLYNQSPSATPRSADGGNDLSPSRSSVGRGFSASASPPAPVSRKGSAAAAGWGASARGREFDVAASAASAASPDTYQPLLSPSTQRLRAQQMQQMQQQAHEELGTADSAFSTPLQSRSPAQPVADDAQRRVQLNLLKRKTSQRSVGLATGVAAPAHATAAAPAHAMAGDSHSSQLPSNASASQPQQSRPAVAPAAPKANANTSASTAAGTAPHARAEHAYSGVVSRRPPIVPQLRLSAAAMHARVDE